MGRVLRRSQLLGMIGWISVFLDGVLERTDWTCLVVSCREGQGKVGRARQGRGYRRHWELSMVVCASCEPSVRVSSLEPASQRESRLVQLSWCACPQPPPSPAAGSLSCPFFVQNGRLGLAACATTFFSAAPCQEWSCRPRAVPCYRNQCGVCASGLECCCGRFQIMSLLLLLRLLVTRGGYGNGDGGAVASPLARLQPLLPSCCHALAALSPGGCL